MRPLYFFIFSFFYSIILSAQPVTDYVDPMIGAEGVGRVVVGPSCPFGMVKPSPDCSSSNNSGWAPMPERVDGFSQTHVSGTGGGPKYGNVLIQPFCSGFEATSHRFLRSSEEIRLGYYGTQYENGIGVEVTTAERAALYRITYPADSAQLFTVDAGWFLGDQVGIDTRESQQFVSSEIEVKSSTEVSGLTRIRGGWNNGRAYTVFFHIQFDKPIAESRLWDNCGKRGVNLRFDGASSQLHARVGISFVGERQAKQNIEQYLGEDSFEAVRAHCVEQWERLLSRISIETIDSIETIASIASINSLAAKRMFYTGLYHTLLEPVDRTGENPGWTDYLDNDPSQGLVPYYDDFYAIWDTYRTSSPLITLLDPERQRDIVRSLINIGRRDGYMPDARSGNSNGRTQGGSNAEIVLADALLKDLPGIDWEEGLRQMLKDATLPPGGNQEAEGRGGLTEYLRLGYVPYGIDRSGNRTMEYAFCDYAIAQVAQRLGYTSLYEQYMRQSGYWKNLWRADYEHAGTRGFIMPRAADGQWLDTLTVGHSSAVKPTFVYTPVTNESPWNQAWWGTVFYEATSWEYSLSVPHDVPGLIEICGGEEAFEQRLDTFFDRGFYNVNNEPSFLTPCLYHWLGRPDRTSDRIRQIITQHFNDQPRGLPGNDDSGAMSSWLAFHMMGLYPNAGTNYYLLHTPLLRSATLHLADGRDFTIAAPKLSAKNRYIVGARLNGEDYPWSAITHQRLMEGGRLELVMGPKPAGWGRELGVDEGGDGPNETNKSNGANKANRAHKPNEPNKPNRAHKPHKPHKPNLANTAHESNETNSPTHSPIELNLTLGHDYRFDFDLRTQHRHFILRFEENADGGIDLHWQLPRPNKVQEGVYRMSAEARAKANELSFEAPVDGNDCMVPVHQLFALLSANAFAQLEAEGRCRYNNSELHLVNRTDHLLHLHNADEGYDLWVNNDPKLPVVVKMKNNPVEIDWTIE